MTATTPAATLPPTDGSAFMPRLRARRAGPIMVGVALFFGLITFLLVTGLLPIAATHEVVLTVLVIDAALVLALIILIVRDIDETNHISAIGISMEAVEPRQTLPVFLNIREMAERMRTRFRGGA